MYKWELRQTLQLRVQMVAGTVHIITYTVNNGAPNTISSEDPGSSVTIPVSTSAAVEPLHLS